MNDDDSAPGWEAIDVALKPLYGDQEPLHWAPILHHALGGPDPIDGISAYRHPGPAPHWHFITYGFSELYTKDSSDPGISGYGFELTFRLHTSTFDEPPPKWVFSFLQNLARYVFSSGNAFDSGHYMNLNSPIALGSDTRLWAIAITHDRELLEIDTPHGHLKFLQIVGITLDELSAIKAWHTDHFLELLGQRFPLLTTDLGRSSLTDHDNVAAIITAGIRADGSSTASLFVGTASWRVDRRVLRADRLHLTLGANGVRDFRVVLPGRLPHGRELSVVSKEHSMTFVPSDQCSWAVGEEGDLNVRLTTRAALELAEVIAPKQGTYRVQSFPALSIDVVKSEIRDHEGRVAEVIG